MNKKDELRIVMNFLNHMPKAYRDRTMNRTVIKDILMAGTSTSGSSSCDTKCRELGLDPYGYDLKVELDMILSEKIEDGFGYAAIVVKGHVSPNLKTHKATNILLQHSVGEGGDTILIFEKKIGSGIGLGYLVETSAINRLLEMKLEKEGS